MNVPTIVRKLNIVLAAALSLHACKREPGENLVVASWEPKDPVTRAQWSKFGDRFVERVFTACAAPAGYIALSAEDIDYASYEHFLMKLRSSDSRTALSGKPGLTSDELTNALNADLDVFFRSYHELCKDGKLASWSLQSSAANFAAARLIIWIRTAGSYRGVVISSVAKMDDDLRVLAWVGLKPDVCNGTALTKQAELSCEFGGHCGRPLSIEFKSRCKDGRVESGRFGDNLELLPVAGGDSLAPNGAESPQVAQRRLTTQSRQGESAASPGTTLMSSADSPWTILARSILKTCRARDVDSMYNKLTWHNTTELNHLRNALGKSSLQGAELAAETKKHEAVFKQNIRVFLASYQDLCGSDFLGVSQSPIVLRQ